VGDDGDIGEAEVKEGAVGEVRDDDALCVRDETSVRSEVGDEAAAWFGARIEDGR
jgi:hypothetical protein